MSNQEISVGTLPASIAPEGAQLAIRRLALISVLAIALGFLMQSLILAAKLVSGGNLKAVFRE